MLFDWQKTVITAMLGLDEVGRWASTEDGLDVARQNGKGVVLQVIEGFVAFELGYPVVMHTAHEFATSQEHQFRLEDMIQNAPHLHAQVKDTGGYRHANGQESINLKSGSRIIFKARTKMGARGYSGDLLVWDEAMVVPDTVVGSMLPMLRASKTAHGPKVIYAGSAVDQEVHEYGVNFARIRERGLARAPRVSWHEWSAPYDHPSQMTTDLLRDRQWWTAANPSIPEGLVSEEYMADEIERMPPRTAAVELGCVGDWPRTDGLDEQVIPVERWLALVDPASGIVGPVCFAFDVTPDRAMATIAAGGRRADGRVHLEVVDRRRGTGWVAGRLAELTKRHRTAGVVCDATSPAASVLPELAQLGVVVEPVSARDHASACGLIYDLVEQQAVMHIGQPELVAALRGAVRRPLGDAWAWSRKSSTVDISPLVAFTLAAWATSSIEKADVFVGTW